MVNGLKNKARNLALQTSGINLPKAMLIIPDGNGRWAKQMGLSIEEGHKQGAKTFSQVLDYFINLDINVLGAWAFSEDNWKRPQEEIDEIMVVIENTVKQNLNKLIENNIRFIALGKREKIQKQYPSLIKTMDDAMGKTLKNTGKKFVLFVDYGEKYQLEQFAKEREKDKLSPTYDVLARINEGVPLFDMVLRTSGELRLSGFGPLASLAEFVSVKKNLPDLANEDILQALKEFSARQRRFGGR